MKKPNSHKRRLQLTALIAVIGSLLFCAAANGYVLFDTADVSSDQVAAAPDGTIWCICGPSGLAKVTPSGQVTQIPNIRVREKGHRDDHPEALTIGPDGNVWVILEHAVRYSLLAYVIRITPDGHQKLFDLHSGRLADHFSIASGPDGNLWFVGSGNHIGRLTLSGKITYFPFRGRTPKAIRLGEPTPFAIVQGADGAMWATGDQSEVFDGTYGTTVRISPSGHQRSYKTDEAADIALGADGNLWIGGWDPFRLTPRGRVTRFDMQYPSLPNNGDMDTPRGRRVFSIATGSHDEIVFTAASWNENFGYQFNPSLGWLSGRGRATEILMDTDYGDDGLAIGQGIVTAPDGRLWVVHGGINIYLPDTPIKPKAAKPTIRSLGVTGEKAHTQLRCSGPMFKYCSGTVTLTSGGKRLAPPRTYALKPLNRLNLDIRLRSRPRKNHVTLTVTSKDPITNAVTTVKRSVHLG